MKDIRRIVTAVESKDYAALVQIADYGSCEFVNKMAAKALEGLKDEV